MKQIEYPEVICAGCGTKYGRWACRIATWHFNVCGVCGQRGAVTEPRDFGHLDTNKLLKDGYGVKE